MGIHYSSINRPKTKPKHPKQCVYHTTHACIFVPPHTHGSFSTQPIGSILDIKDGPVLLPLDALVPQHARILPHVLALDLELGLGGHGIEHEVVVAVRAVLVGVLHLAGVLAEALFALFAGKRHLEGLQQLVVGLLLGVAFGAVEPGAAAGRADGDLCVEDVAAVRGRGG